MQNGVKWGRQSILKIVLRLHKISILENKSGLFGVYTESIKYFENVSFVFENSFIPFNISNADLIIILS
jgi:hypothetical protein